MKIALDMQSRQTAGSRERGIGRYSLSLARAMLRLGRPHEFSILLNGVFDRSLDLVMADFEVEADDPRISVYQTLPHSTEWTAADSWRHKASELLRESFLAAKGFDFVHCTSLFESPMDDSSTSWGQVPNRALQGVTLYDLIPYVFQEIYLQEPAMRSYYLRKIQELRRADLLLAISDFSRHEAIERLGVDPRRVVNIAGAADTRFRVVQIAPTRREQLLHRFGLGKFIMYTGGIDYRKNIERLIEAYAVLPERIIAAYQLVIVCSVQPGQREVLLRLASSHGLAADRVVMTGFVSDEDLVDFYNLCDLFVFPSWCEGFGLPALEAMQCGAPVLAAGTSSLPEVVGLTDALFDPYSIQDMATKIIHALEDEGFRRCLVEHGKQHVRRFTWENSATIALDAMEEVHAQRVENRTASVNVPFGAKTRPRMAFVSPLPPSRSGISGYSAQLLPFLDAHYDITLICVGGEVSDDYLASSFPVRTPAWLAKNASQFERVIYQFGNSDHHSHMFDLLERVPGTVVLHDFWLSNVLEYIQLYENQPCIWDQHLHYSHGWPALSRRQGEGHDIPLVNEYPCNRKVIDSAVGLIVHSQFSADLVADWYGPELLDGVRLVNSQKAVVANVDKNAAKTRLGFPTDEALICSFGFIHSTKHSLRLAKSFLASSLYREGKARLVLVGQNADGEYGHDIAQVAAQSAGRISFTGFVSDADYSLYLHAADAAVQLRGMSRGETSAAALDCLAHQVALVINDNGAFSQIPDEAVIRIPAEFDDTALVQELDRLLVDNVRLAQLRARGTTYLQRECHPARVAEGYRDAIEHFYECHAVALRTRLVDRMSRISARVPASADDQDNAVAAVVVNFPDNAAKPVLYLHGDVLPQLAEREPQRLREWFVDTSQSRRTELLRVDEATYFNAIVETAAFLGVDAIRMPNQGFDLRGEDVVLLGSHAVLALPASRGLQRLLRDARSCGATLACYWPNLEVDLDQQGAEGISGPLLALLPAIARIMVGSERAARFVLDHIALGGALLGSRPPSVHLPECEAAMAADNVRQLVLNGDAPGWRRANPSPARARAWLATDSALMTQSGVLRDGFYQTQGDAGFLVYGPYAALAPGRYRLSVFGKLAASAGGDVRLEVAADKGRDILHQGNLSAGFWHLEEVDLTVQQAVRDVEIRIWVPASAQMAFRGYYFLPLQHPSETGETP